MADSYINGNLQVSGTIYAGGWTVPAGAINNAAIAAAAAIDASKVQQQYVLTHTQKTGTDVTAQTHILHIARAAGTLLDVDVVADTVPTGNGVDKTVTVDIKKSTAGGAFSTLLTGTIQIDSADTDKTPIVGTPVATPTYIAGDLIESVVTVAGSVGTQAQGLCVRIILNESP